MRGVVKILIGLTFVLLAGWLVAAAISKVRNAANLMQCQNNLKAIGLALDNYHNANGHFPTGTLPNPDLSPDKRLSWLVQVWPAYMRGGWRLRLDETKAWDATENCPPRCSVRQEEHTYKEQLVGQLGDFLCPANPTRTDPSLPSPTHYLGIAGLGATAAELPLSAPRAGFFGYDRKVSRGDIKDGTATTLAVSESLDGGPWTAGGWATVRGLANGEVPYLGEAGQFTSSHRGSKLFPLTQPIVANVLCADGAVHRLTASTSPQVFEALATIAGNEEVAPLDGE